MRICHVISLQKYIYQIKKKQAKKFSWQIAWHVQNLLKLFAGEDSIA